jgi:hypothetical protein
MLAIGSSSADHRGARARRRAQLLRHSLVRRKSDRGTVWLMRAGLHGGGE